MAHSDGIRKVSATDATVLLTIADAQNARAVTVDGPHGVLWAYRANTVSAYGFDGKPLISIRLDPHSDNGNSQDVALGVNPNNGTVWLGLKKFLYHFSARGEWLSVHTLPGEVRALAWDATTSCLWVGTKESVSAIDDAGAMCGTRDLGSHLDVQGLAVDADSGELWGGLKKVLRRYDADGVLLLEINFDKLAYLAGDHQGGVWIAADKNLFRIDRFGRVLVATVPFDDKIIALATDPTNASVWVASKSELSHLRSDGHRLHDLKFKGEIRDLALYADVIPPTLALVAPHDGSALNTNTPNIKLHYRDSGSGVDPATLVLQTNGRDGAVSCHFSDAEATCTPVRALPEGQVTLTATIQDYAGNTAEPATRTITIDTTPPLITVTAPLDGSVTNQARQTVVGSLSEAATLTLNGTSVPVGPNRAFSYGPLSLQEGLNTFALIATDAVGNSSHRSVRVTLDTVPPTAVDQRKVNVSEVSDGQVQVSGPVGSVEPGTKITLTNIRTGQAVTVTANVDGSFTGTIVAQSGDVISIMATDTAGNVSAPSTMEGGSTLPPEPSTIAPPLDRAVATDLASATAFLYTGSQPIQTGRAQFHPSGYALEPARGDQEAR
jgi:hypothetical protein